MSMNGKEFPDWSDNRSQTKNGSVIEPFQFFNGYEQWRLMISAEVDKNHIS